MAVRANHGSDEGALEVLVDVAAGADVTDLNTPACRIDPEDDADTPYSHATELLESGERDTR